MLNLSQEINHVVVSSEEYQRLLGFPADFNLADSDQDLIGRIAQAKEWYNTHGKPWTFTQLIDDIKITNNHVELNGVVFVSSVLRQKLFQAKAHSVVLVAVSAGPEAEAHAAEHWKNDRPDDYFFLEMYASSVVESLVTHVGGQLCRWAEQQGDKVLPHYSPGYTGWDMADQEALFNLFQHSPEHPFSDRIDILCSGMLKPKKSLIGLFGITRRENVADEVNSLIPCKQCSLNNCAFRRKPYVPPNYTIEGIRAAEAVLPPPSETPMPLTVDAKYAYGQKVLKKWCASHLNLEAKPDGTVESTFHFEGSTCSNAGVEIKYDYHVYLSRPQDGYKILEMHCHPSKGDDGFSFQCQYVTHGESFLKEIDEHKPLLGQPLDDILTWEPDLVPSGCLCGTESRNHKWKIVLQSLHYGLMNDQNNTIREQLDTYL